MSDRNRRREDILLRLLEEPEERRRDLLSKLCSDDIDLERQVARDLERADEAGAVAERMDAFLAPLSDRTPNRAAPAEDGTATPFAGGSTIGPFRVVRRIASGGMGTVYLAERTDGAGPHVALKVINAGMNTDEVIERFRGEYAALRQMNDEGIAQVYEFGTTDHGEPFFAMEHVDGPNIVDFCSGNRLEIDERVRLFLPVCDALAHAHSQGILHRDVKPSNVLVDTTRSPPRPKVIDFGIAKALTGRLHDATATNAWPGLLGTPAYMSPERLVEDGFVDQRSDVYSLGVTLYEMVTERRAHPGESRAEVVRRVLNREPIAPRRIDVRIPVDLETVVLKAIATEPERRYESVRDFASDLGRYLGRAPVVARRAGFTTRVARWTRRHRPFVVGAGTVGAVSVVAVVALLLWFNHRLRRQADDLVRRTQALERSRHIDELGRAQRALDLGDFRRARSLLESRTRFTASTETREVDDFAVGHLWRKLDVEARLMRLPDAPIADASFLPDGHRIATMGTRRDRKKTAIGLWRTESGNLENSWPIWIDLEGRSITVTPDGQHLLVSDFWKPLVAWIDVSTAEVRFETVQFSQPHSPGFSKDGSTLALTTGQVHLVDRSTLRLFYTWMMPSPVAAIALSSDERRLFAGGRTELFVVDLPEFRSLERATRQRVTPAPVSSPTASTVRAILPSGPSIVVAYEDGRLSRRNAETLEELQWTIHERGIESAAMSPDGRWVATGGRGNSDVALRRADTLEVAWRFRGHGPRVFDVEFSPDSTMLLCASDDGAARLWPVERRRASESSATVDSVLWEARFRADGRLVTEDSKLRFSTWNATAGRESTTLEPKGTVQGEAWSRSSVLWHGKSVDEMCKLSPDGSFVAISTPERTIRLSATESNPAPTDGSADGESAAPPMTIDNELESLDNPIYGMGFSADGRRFGALALGYEGQTLRARLIVWKRALGSSFRDRWGIELDRPVGVVSRQIALSSKYRCAILGGRHGTDVEVWSLESGRPLTRFSAQPFVATMNLSRAEDLLVTSGEDGSLSFWSVSELARPSRDASSILTERCHDSRINAVAFLHDGRHLVTGPRHGRAKLWRFRHDGRRAEIREIFELSETPGEVKGLAVSPDGLTVAAVGRPRDRSTGWIRLWYADELVPGRQP